MARGYASQPGGSPTEGPADSNARNPLAEIEHAKTNFWWIQPIQLFVSTVNPRTFRHIFRKRDF